MSCETATGPRFSKSLGIEPVTLSDILGSGSKPKQMKDVCTFFCFYHLSRKRNNIEFKNNQSDTGRNKSYVWNVASTALLRLPNNSLLKH